MELHRSDDFIVSVSEPRGPVANLYSSVPISRQWPGRCSERHMQAAFQGVPGHVSGRQTLQNNISARVFRSPR
jgi:hypothetical protein